MLLKKFITLIVTALAVASVATEATTTTTTKKSPRVHAGVHRALRKQGTVNLILTMQDGTEKALTTTKEAQFTTRGDQIASLVASLEQHTSTSQQQVTSLLSQEVGTQQPLFAKSKSLWITNQLYIEGATFELVEKLAQLNSIAEIREEEVFEAPRLTESGAPTNSTSGLEATSIAWGVKKIQAPEVWAKGYTGQNIVVGVIDGGARGTHEALRGNFVGEYGWYDPYEQRDLPYDEDGHGSHVLGSITGSNGIGVAPGAKWMACRGCNANFCLEAQMIACTQFMLCPTDTKGGNKDCLKAPHVVNNSWSSGQGKTQHAAIVAAWHAAGIIPVFAAGNVLLSCGSVKSPADFPNVIAVGATNENDSLLFVSGNGPSKGGLRKPDLTAPGGDISSAWFDGDASYHVTFGTSMAAPHVTGAIALLLSAKPDLNYDQVLEGLTSTAETQVLVSANRTCGGTPDSVFPNNIFGYGRINILDAVARQ